MKYWFFCSIETLVSIHFTNTNQNVVEIIENKKFFQILKILTRVLGFYVCIVSFYHMTYGRQNTVMFNLKLLFGFCSHFTYKVHLVIHRVQTFLNFVFVLYWSNTKMYFNVTTTKTVIDNRSIVIDSNQILFELIK